MKCKQIVAACLAAALLPTLTACSLFAKKEEEPQQTAEPKTGVICPHCGQLVPLTVCVGHHPAIIPPSGSAGSSEQKSSEDGSAL